MGGSGGAAMGCWAPACEVEETSAPAAAPAARGRGTRVGAAHDAGGAQPWGEPCRGPHLRALLQAAVVVDVVVRGVHPQLLTGHGLQVGQLALQRGEMAGRPRRARI